MKERFSNILYNASSLTVDQLDNVCMSLARDLQCVSPDMLSITKVRFGASSWCGLAHANIYYFGEQFSNIIRRACKLLDTHDPTREFTISDATELIADFTFDYIYRRTIY